MATRTKFDLGNTTTLYKYNAYRFWALVGRHFAYKLRRRRLCDKCHQPHSSSKPNTPPQHQHKVECDAMRMLLWFCVVLVWSSIRLCTIFQMPSIRQINASDIITHSVLQFWTLDSSNNNNIVMIVLWVYGESCFDIRFYCISPVRFGN